MDIALGSFQAAFAACLHARAADALAGLSIDYTTAAPRKAKKKTKGLSMKFAGMKFAYSLKGFQGAKPFGGGFRGRAAP
jgi:hypothetical protein